MSNKAPISTPASTPLRQHVSRKVWLTTAPDNRITEWIDGQVIEISPVTARHDLISQWLITILRVFLEERPSGTLRAAPFVLKLSKSACGREPDLMFIATHHADRLYPTYVAGPADAVFEITSPESAERDRTAKWQAYQTEGIPEYWRIDPDRQQLTLYHLDADGHYQPAPPSEGKFVSAQIQGFYLRPEWLWAPTPPRALQILQEFGLI